MMTPSEEKLYQLTLALAGIFQAAVLVRDFAKNGTGDEAAFAASIGSVCKIDAKDVLSVYGEESGLRVGLMELVRWLGDEKKEADRNISRYVIGLFHLERRLMRDKAMTKALLRRLEYAVSQAKYFSETHQTVLSTLADTYLKTLGNLPYRIQVIGQARYLNQSEVVDKIRALLLAGVRSAVLWRQMGGRRWYLFLWRKKLANTAQKILGKRS